MEFTRLYIKILLGKNSLMQETFLRFNAVLFFFLQKILKLLLILCIIYAPSMVLLERTELLHL